MKKTVFIFCIGLCSTVLQANKADQTVVSNTPFRFTDTPEITELSNYERNRTLQTVTEKTIIIVGSGGYDSARDILCPDTSSEKCGTIITAFIDGNYGPEAEIQIESNGEVLHGIIDEPIFNEDGEVINFVFSSVWE